METIALTARQKFMILQSLDRNVCIKLDVNQKWFVDSRFEIGGNGFLTSDCGRGETPELAVEEHFHIYCQTLPDGRYVRCDGKNWRWSGFHWERVEKNA